MNESPVFNTDKRIRLGIWGLGRGMCFYRSCAALNFDVVAGCDYNEYMRENFLEHNPDAFATADADEFLARDFDAVLVATFCPDHAGDVLRCLAAGKHVLSEVTAFHTMAEGVELVEAVEKSGLIYNLAENYPHGKGQRYLKRKWDEGLFGEMMYAEFEYLHNCRNFCYTYIDSVPIQPGNTVHYWRTWINFHYYCTHSLGPVMVITGLRPTRVTSLPGTQKLAGYLVQDLVGMGGIATSLINMNNGSVMRNLMGSTTNDGSARRIWGTKGSAELIDDKVFLRLGGNGESPKLEVTPTGDELDELASTTGHSGGDWWVLYYFARQILFGEKAPFDVYDAADVTIPGIQATRSMLADGRPFDVPDFRDPAARDMYRTDNWAQERYDTVNGVFPADADLNETQHFSTIMSDLLIYSELYRQYNDWKKVKEDMIEPAKLGEMLDKLIEKLPKVQANYAAARKLADMYPGSDGARVLREMLEEIGDETRVMAPGFAEELQHV